MTIALIVMGVGDFVVLGAGMRSHPLCSPHDPTLTFVKVTIDPFIEAHKGSDDAAHGLNLEALPFLAYCAPCLLVRLIGEQTAS